MFKMFGFGGVQCPRCDHRNGDTSGYCNQCGLTLGAPHNAPVLRENRWVPGNDELAVYFGVRQLAQRQLPNLTPRIDQADARYQALLKQFQSRSSR